MLSKNRQNRPSTSYIFLQLAPRKSKKGIFRNQWRSGGTRSSPTWPYLWSHPVIFSYIFNELKKSQKCLRLDLPAQVCSSGKPGRCNISARRWRWQAHEAHCSLWPTNLRSSYARDDASSLSGRGFDMLGFWLWGGVLTDSNHASWSSETAHFGHFWENLPSIEWIRMTWRHEDMKRISDLALFALNAAQTAVHASAAPATLLRHQPAHGCSWLLSRLLHVIGSFWFSDIYIYTYIDWSILGLNLPYVK